MNTLTATSILGAGKFSTRGQIVAASCACACATAFLFAVDPSHHAVYPQCLLYNTTGIYCAGCGATRAAYALLHGRVLDALHDNALFIATLPFLLYVIGSYIAAAWRVNAWPKLFPDTRTLTRRGIAIVLVLIGFMIVRNLPGWPFELLHPL
jgi:hypothetical protein